MIYLPIPNSSIRLANLQAGSLQLVECIVPTDVAAIQQDPKLKLIIGHALGYSGITISANRDPAANTALGQHALVRQALDMSIDRQALSDIVYDGMYAPPVQANSANSPFYVSSIQPPLVDIAAEVIQAMTKQVGFDTRIKAMEFVSSL